jgi:O-methyltransferase
MIPMKSEDLTPEQLYLDLMKKSLTYYLWGGDVQTIRFALIHPRAKRMLYSIIASYVARDGYRLYTQEPFDAELRKQGKDHPALSQTMIGLARLDNLQYCTEQVLRENIPGDLIETGVWRGGATIFMRAVLKAYQVKDRRVWVADSFEGLPLPNPNKYPADKDDRHHMMSNLAVSLEEVKSNFAKYGLLDEQVVFLPGWFKDTLPVAKIERLSVLRLDGDMYESTMDALVHLYPKLSRGGYVIVDDYGYIASCRQAVHDFRSANGIEDEIVPIDWTGVDWKKTC